MKLSIPKIPKIPKELAKGIVVVVAVLAIYFIFKRACARKDRLVYHRPVSAYNAYVDVPDDDFDYDESESDDEDFEEEEDSYDEDSEADSEADYADEWYGSGSEWDLPVQQQTKTNDWEDSSPTPGPTNTSGLKRLGEYVMTWYGYEDNTPCSSSLTSSGRPLIPFVSVAVPFRLLKKHGGPLDYGDQLFVKFLENRKMPNGKLHTGWVQLDDMCGDGGNDSYCFQSVKGKKYPNVDLYIGAWKGSGMDPKTCSGPAGSGQEKTDVFHADKGKAPSGKFINDYGGAKTNGLKCGDCAAAKREMGKCMTYTPPSSSAKWCKDVKH